MPENNKTPLTVGILAHVDAGKTTLTEALLYLSGKLKKLGRVDTRDSFLDTHTLERQRGITIFSKQAVFQTEKHNVTLLDTPGHVDFSAETERALSVLDVAVLVISGTDGVQAHTETLWALLRRYNVPCFVFITKMDLPTADKNAILTSLASRLGDECIDFTQDISSRDEAVALTSDGAMDEYDRAGGFSDAFLAKLTADRALFPCFFGSGLKLDGVEALIRAFDAYTLDKTYPAEFSARVFKIARDAQNRRMTFVKLTGGALDVRTALKYNNPDGEAREEKITQIRLYSGLKFDSPD